MKRKLVALAILAAIVLIALQQLQGRTDFFRDAKSRIMARILQGGLLAAAAVLAFPLLSFWPAIALASGILAVTGALTGIGKAFSPQCPDGLTRDDDSDVCLGFTP